MTRQLIFDHITTDVGTIITVFDQGILCALDFTDCEERCFRILSKYYPGHILEQRSDPFGFRLLMDRYMAGDFSAFKDVDVRLKGTEFQKSVWRALRGIPAGKTISYGDLAKKIGRPKAVRALGHANSLNPVALVLPCHRVIGRDGSLTGYAGGLDRKKWLLEHEINIDIAVNRAGSDQPAMR